MDMASGLIMSQADQSKLKFDVDRMNKEIAGDRKVSNQMDKDDFLKILITQLQNQDPSAPMEDKEFIAQMAQFSSLEQMTNMATNFSKLSSTLTGGEAFSALGREVDVQDKDGVVKGMVTEVVRGDTPQIKVNGKLYDYSNVLRVRDSAGTATAAAAEAYQAASVSE
jgi:flagellar basal-body rod modification protein FlgD